MVTLRNATQPFTALMDHMGCTTRRFGHCSSKTASS